MNDVKPWRDLGRLPRELWILCAATFVNRLGAMALPFLVLYATEELKFTAERAAIALAVYGAVALIAGPIGGRLADSWGPQATMLASLLSAGVVLLLFPLAQSWTAVIAMTALWSSANESFRPANLAIVGELGSGEHGKSAFTLMRFAGNLGMSVGPAIGGFLAQVSFPSIFIVNGLTSLVAGGIVMWAPVRYSVKTHAPRAGIFEPLRQDPKLRIFLLGIIPVSMVFCQISASLTLFVVRNLGLSEAAYGLLFTLNTLMIITMEIPISSMTSRWPHTHALGLGSFLIGAGFGLMAFAGNFLHVALTVVVWTFGEMLLFPAMSTFVSDIAPQGRRGQYMGLYMMSFNLAFRFAGPWAGIVVLERFGAAILCVGMFGAGLLSAIMLATRK